MAQAQIGTDPHEKTRLELEQKFAKEHSKASDEELLAYLRRQAQELGRLPEKADITGYQLMLKATASIRASPASIYTHHAIS